MHMMQLIPRVLSGSILSFAAWPDLLHLFCCFSLLPGSSITGKACKSIYFHRKKPCPLWSAAFWTLNLHHQGKRVMSGRLKTIVAQGG
jgi:hypothetical protein